MCGLGGRRLIDVVDHWLQDVSPGAHLQLRAVSDADTVIAGFTFDRAADAATRRYRAANVGFGLSYVLPVVLGLLAPPGTLCLIENPRRICIRAGRRGWRSTREIEIGYVGVHRQLSSRPRSGPRGLPDRRGNRQRTPGRHGVDGYPTRSDEGAQRAFGHFLVIGNGERGSVILLDQNDVASPFSGH